MLPPVSDERLSKHFLHVIDQIALDEPVLPADDTNLDAALQPYQFVSCRRFLAILILVTFIIQQPLSV